MSSSLLDRFTKSMEMNHERWHDGIGYDLGLLETATPEEAQQVESFLLSRGVRDWRDIEALAALDTPATRARLRKTLGESSDLELKLALVQYARDILSEEETTGILLPILQERGIHDGLTGALLVVEDFHPAPIRAALLAGALHREGPIAMEFATMLLFLHGRIASLYEMEERPFLLRFLEGERGPVFLELCERIHVAAPPLVNGETRA